MGIWWSGVTEHLLHVELPVEFPSRKGEKRKNEGLLCSRHQYRSVIPVFRFIIFSPYYYYIPPHFVSVSSSSSSSSSPSSNWPSQACSQTYRPPKTRPNRSTLSQTIQRHSTSTPSNYGQSRAERLRAKQRRRRAPRGPRHHTSETSQEVLVRR